TPDWFKNKGLGKVLHKRKWASDNVHYTSKYSSTFTITSFSLETLSLFRRSPKSIYHYIFNGLNIIPNTIKLTVNFISDISYILEKGKIMSCKIIIVKTSHKLKRFGLPLCIKSFFYSNTIK